MQVAVKRLILKHNPNCGRRISEPRDQRLLYELGAFEPVLSQEGGFALTRATKRVVELLHAHEEMMAAGEAARNSVETINPSPTPHCPELTRNTLRLSAARVIGAGRLKPGCGVWSVST
jgi:hypothetical protein